MKKFRVKIPSGATKTLEGEDAYFRTFVYTLGGEVVGHRMCSVVDAQFARAVEKVVDREWSNRYSSVRGDLHVSREQMVSR